MTVRRLKAGGQSINRKHHLMSFGLLNFSSVKALSFTSASSGSMPDRSTVDGMILNFLFQYFELHQINCRDARTS